MTAKKQKASPPNAEVRAPKKRHGLTGKGGHKNKVVNSATHTKVRRIAREEIQSEYSSGLERTTSGKALVIQDEVPRPTKYTEVLGRRVCLMFATNSRMTLGRMNADPTLPTVSTLYEWLIDHPDFEKLYNKSRQIQQDVQAEELADDADKARKGEIRVTRTGIGAKGEVIDTEEVRTIDNVDRSRLYIETRKWILSKQRPKKYGVQPIEVDGDGGGLKDLLDQFRQRSKAIEDGD